MILGAGAVSLGLLKGIMAKHLAIALQNISFLLLEFENIVLHINKTNNNAAIRFLEKEYDIITSDLHNHLNENLKKLSSILSQKMIEIFNSCLDENWNESTEIKHSYIDNLAKIVKQMHSAISFILQQKKVNEIFSSSLDQTALVAQNVYRSINIKSERVLEM